VVNHSLGEDRMISVTPELAADEWLRRRTPLGANVTEYIIRGDR